MPDGPRVRVDADLILEIDAGADGSTAGTVTSEDGHLVVEVADPVVLLRALGPGGRRGSPLPALVPPGASGELRGQGRVLARVLPAGRTGPLGRVASAVLGDPRLAVRPALAGPLLRANGPAARRSAGLGALALLVAAVLARRRRAGASGPTGG